MPRRLPWSLLVASLVLNAMYAALAGIVVPAQLAGIDDSAKEFHLAWIMAASSAVTLVVHPLVGAWSDRVSSRWGRRTPWIAVGAVASGAAILALGRAESVLAVALGWLVVQPLLNVVEAPLDAVLADRVPTRARPRVAAHYSGGAAVGLAVGSLVASALIGQVGLVTAVLAGALVVTMLGFVVLNPEGASRPRRRSLRWREALRHRNFRLVFAARFLVALGSQMVLGYVLYIIMDRTGADAEEAGRTVPLVIGAHIVCIVLGALVASRQVGGNRVRAVVAATAVTAIGLLLPLLVPGFAGLVAYAVVSGLGRGAFLTADLALVLDVLPSRDDAGRDLGVFGLASILPQSAAPVLAGALLAATSTTYSALFGVAAALALSSMLVVARVRVAPRMAQPSSSP